jgi:hypothetical protein
MPVDAQVSTSPDRNDGGQLPGTVSGMIRYWELRRIWYNAALVLLVVGWIVGTWPHFQPALTLDSLGKMIILAVIANVCYSTAYAVDFVVQASTYSPAWRRRWRAVLWIAGTLFALLVAQYWIGDEIYPDVRGP